MYIEGNEGLSNGYYIASRSEYLKMRGELDGWYSKNNDDDIKLINKQLKKELYKDLKQPLPNANKQTVFGYVYFVIADNAHFKIGCTSNLMTRIKSLKSASPNNLELIAYAYVDDYGKLEDQTHKHFKDKKIHGEWFDITYADINDWLNEIGVEIHAGKELEQ